MKKILFLILLLILLVLPAEPGTVAAAGGLWVTDVTPRSFSLVWTTDQAATGSANVYTDPQGNQLVAGITITDESAAYPPAGDNGVMKVRVSGLVPDTTYFYEIVTTSSAGEVVEPESGDRPSVRTEVSSRLVDNYGLAYKVFQSDGTTPGQGTLVLAEVAGGSHFISGWVGDGAPPDYPWLVLLDFSNIYSLHNHMNLTLTGGEALKLTSVGGILGFRRLSATVPTKTDDDIDYYLYLNPLPADYQCTLDTSAPVIDTNQVEPSPGALINDNTPLIAASYADQDSEIDPDSVRLLVDGVDVTDISTVDLSGIEYTPTTSLPDGRRSVALDVSDQWGYAADPFNWTFTVEATPPTATVEYSTLAATSRNVVATLVPSEAVTVTNNNGATTYTFTDNGVFTFEFADAAGNTGSATATVSNIDSHGE